MKRNIQRDPKYLCERRETLQDSTKSKFPEKTPGWGVWGHFPWGFDFAPKKAYKGRFSY